VGLKGKVLVPVVIALAVSLYFALYYGLKKGKEPDLLKKYLENHAVSLLGDGTAFAFPPKDINQDGLPELLAFVPEEAFQKDTFVFTRGVLLQTRPRKTTQLLRFGKDGIRNSKGALLYEGDIPYRVVLDGNTWRINNDIRLKWDAAEGIYRKY
jgi:hypothetical protein